MSKDILRVRLTHNVKQLKKYVDEAISKGAKNVGLLSSGGDKIKTNF